MPPTRTDLMLPGTFTGTSTPHVDITNHVPTCDESDVLTHRLFSNSSGTGYTVMSTEDYDALGAEAPEHLGFSRDSYDRLYALRGHWLYSAALENGRHTTLFQPICREAQPINDTYRLYFSDMPELLHPASYPGLMGVPLRLTPAEVTHIVRGLPSTESGDPLTTPLTDNQYGVDAGDPTSLSLFPDLPLIERIITAINHPESPIPEERRTEIVSALHSALASAQRDVDFRNTSLSEQREMRDEMRWTQWATIAITAGLTVYSTALATGKAGTFNYWISRPAALGWNLLQDSGTNLFSHHRWNPGTWDMINSRNTWRDLDARIRYRHIPTLLQIGTNLTALARQGEIRTPADPTTPLMAEMIENRIRITRGSASALFEAPPGYGKEVLMRTLALRNPELTFIQNNPDSMMGGTRFRGDLEERIANIPREVEASLRSGHRVIMAVDEFHEMATAGRSMEESRTLLERWKGPLANGQLVIVGFSTPQEMLKVRYIAGFYGTRDNPSGRDHLRPEELRMIEEFDRDSSIRPNIELRALLNRFQVINATPRPASDIVTILRDEIDYRRSQGTSHIEMDDSVLREIARLSESERTYEGHIPRTAFGIFDGVIVNRSAGLTAGSTVRITLENLHQFVARDYPVIATRFGTPGSTPASSRSAPSASTRSEARREVSRVEPTTIPADWEAEFTRTIDGRALEAALRTSNPSLAEILASEGLISSADPIRDVASFVHRIRSYEQWVNRQRSSQGLPTLCILNDVLTSPTLEGRSLRQSLDRALIETLARVAESSGLWSSEPIERTRLVESFVRSLRSRSGLEAARERPTDPRPEETRREEENRPRPPRRR